LTTGLLATVLLATAPTPLFTAAPCDQALIRIANTATIYLAVYLAVYLAAQDELCGFAS
jgi:hypothetical protein